MKWKERAVLFKFNYHQFKIYLPLNYQQGTNSHWLPVWCELQWLDVHIQLAMLFMIIELQSCLPSKLQWLGMRTNPNLETSVYFFCLFYFVVCFCTQLCWSVASLHFPQLSQSRGVQYWGVSRCVSICRWFQCYMVKKRVLHIMKDNVLFVVKCLRGLNVLLRENFYSSQQREEGRNNLNRCGWDGYTMQWCIRILVDKVKLELALFNHCLPVLASGTMKEK